MKYSIILSYRDRLEHLQIQLEHLKTVFQNKEHEILICAQNDNDPFNKSVLYNNGATKATGDILVFLDVDHISGENVDWFRLEDENLNVYYPIYNVIYIDYNSKELPMDQIPIGYRTHRYQVHRDHFGGVFICKKQVFFDVNGMNPFFQGWGGEDTNILNRFLNKGYDVVRANRGTFFALPHRDNHPGENNHNFQDNQMLNNPHHKLSNSFSKYGINSLISSGFEKCEEVKINIENVRWFNIQPDHRSLFFNLHEANKDLARWERYQWQVLGTGPITPTKKENVL